MTGSVSAINFEQDGWWEDYVQDNRPAAAGDALNSDTSVADPSSPSPLFQLMQQSSDAFFEQNMSKGDFFQVCCLSWMQRQLQQQLLPTDNENGVEDGNRPAPFSPQSLYDALVDAYIDGSQSRENWIVQWILPPSKAMTCLEDADLAGDATDRYMKFWKQLFRAMEHSKEKEEEEENVQPSTKKRRRLLGKYCDSLGGAGHGSLFEGNYKLAAAYLLISVLMKNDTQNWEQLQDQAHQLASSFPTLTGRDIDAALVLVGLQILCTGGSMDGLDIEGLCATYLTKAE